MAFSELDTTVAAGYPRTVKACLSHGEQDATGFHHMNPTYVDDRLEVDKPEILLYERTTAGTYRQNGVEYIIPYRVWSRDSLPPTIMNLPLARSDELKLWYLHAWVWRDNPTGLFSDWNPNVQCPAP